MVAKWRPIKRKHYCEAGGLSGSMPIRSLTAKRNFRSQPSPSRNWIWSSSPPARWQSLAQLPKIMRREFFDTGTLCGGLDDLHSTLGVMPVPQTRPALLVDRKIPPSVIQPASFHSSIAAFTHDGIGTVRMCPALPRRSAITQCSSRDWMESTRRVSNSPRRSHIRSASRSWLNLSSPAANPDQRQQATPWPVQLSASFQRELRSGGRP